MNSTTSPATSYGLSLWSPAGVCKFIPCNVLCRSCRKLRRRDSLMPLGSVRPNTDALHLLILQMIMLNKGVDLNPELSDWNWVIGVFFFSSSRKSKSAELFFFLNQVTGTPAEAGPYEFEFRGYPSQFYFLFHLTDQLPQNVCFLSPYWKESWLQWCFFSMTNILHIVKHGVCVSEELY